jgi:hypothetical protein
MKLWDGEKYRVIACSVEAAGLVAAGFVLVDDDAPPPAHQYPHESRADAAKHMSESMEESEKAAPALKPAPKPAKPEK